MHEPDVNIEVDNSAQRRLFDPQRADEFTLSNFSAPSASHPDWPNQRDLDRYEHLVGFSIRDELSHGGVYLDIGPGSHAVALRSVENISNTTLVALTPHTVDVQGTRIIVEHGRIPDALTFVEKYAHSCRVVTDIFSSVTYVNDPAYALAVLSLLTDDQGIVGIFTELDKFGSNETWGVIENFFREHTGQNVRFEKFRIKGDAEPIWVDSLRITIEGTSHRSKTDLQTLRENLRKTLGDPSVGREIWRTKDGSAIIAEINYGAFPVPKELMRLATVQSVEIP